MTRSLRINLEGALYHVTVRGNEKKNIYRTDGDRHHFLSILADVAKKRGWACYAYCLMDNHYHLLIKVESPTLSQGMRDINSTYSQRFNRMHKRVGHLFQGRFHSAIIESEGYFLEAVRYVVLNPVRANLVSNAGEWKWSSYRGTIGSAKPHRLLDIKAVLERFGGNIQEARQKYAQFVSEGLHAKSPFAKNHDHRVIGEIDWNNPIAKEAWKAWYEYEIPLSDRMLGRPLLKDIFDDPAVTAEHRNTAIVFACRGCGYTRKAVADALRVHPSTISRIVNDARFGT
jgi:REP element-mobilizing transposase RayT